MKSPIEQLREVTAISCQEGNWNYNEYMFGMANGLILALAIMEGVTPVYKDKPDVFLENVKKVA